MEELPLCQERLKSSSYSVTLPERWVSGKVRQTDRLLTLVKRLSKGTRSQGRFHKDDSGTSRLRGSFTSLPQPLSGFWELNLGLHAGLVVSDLMLGSECEIQVC